MAGASVPVRKCATGALTPEADQAQSQNMKECRALSRQWLTPKMSGLLDRIGRAQRQSLDQMGPEAAKRHYELAAEVLDLPGAPLARVLDLQVPVRDGSGRPARLYAPSLEPCLCCCTCMAAGSPGSLETHDSLCRQIALRAGVSVLALTTGWRQSTGSPSPCMTPRMPWHGCAGPPARWACKTVSPSVAIPQAQPGRRAGHPGTRCRLAAGPGC